MARRTLTAQQLREFLHYDPATGVFTRRVTMGPQKIGAIAGSKNRRGYLVINVAGSRYSAHRLAWLYMTGAWPTSEIDHRDSIGSHNWFSNLRPATQAENLQNIRQAHRDSSTGFLGVALDKRDGKYFARIRTGSEIRYLGRFRTPEAASVAYLAAKAKLHPFQTIVVETP